MASINERIGFGFRPADARSALEKIVRADDVGFSTIWAVNPALGRDTLTIFAAAAQRTSSARLGTSIVPAFGRHPLAMITQVGVIEDLAPGRLRLGVGTSHQRTMIASYGLDFEHPLAKLREYLNVLRPALRDGEVNYEGEFYTAKARFTTAPDTPILISALREKAFEMAGELTDGGISWVTPVDYLVSTSLAAIERGAQAAGRPTPPLIAHTFISAQADRDAVRNAVRANLAYYVEAPFYQRMFAAAGYPLGPRNEISDAAIDALTISGDAGEIREQIQSRLDAGIGELLLDVVPMGTDQSAEENAVFNIVRAM